MKNISKYAKKVFTLSLVAMLTVGVFTACSKTGLKIIKDENKVKALLYQDGNFKISEEILDRYGNQSATGRYLNTSPDGMINWNEDKIYSSKSKNIDLISKDIKLDGKNISLPMTFADLGKQYEEFDNFDYSKLNSSEKNIILENTNNKMSMLIADTGINTITEGLGYEDAMLDAAFYEGGRNKLNIRANINTGKIIGVITNDWNLESERKLTIKGIGAGNTFNEMYSKFGTPNRVKIVDNKYSKDTHVLYLFADELHNVYSVYFIHNENMYDIQNYIKTKPNVITSVGIYHFESDKVKKLD